eukprot:INCI11650.1.p1 GENE.INCI11650.1~~INCI11650.1.p1  ORF type:complete len:119 (-),score=25.70 INCI11650.1:19-375(-)
MSKTKSGGLTFIKKSEGSEQTKTVSARVPESVYKSFQTAVDVAANNGYSLSITDVVIQAMKEAIKEVKGACGEEAFQVDLPLSDKPADSKPAVVPAVVAAKPAAQPQAPVKAAEPAKK